MVPFAGFLLPVEYASSGTGGIIAEHMAVREKAGLFDVSHMGEVMLSGPEALANLNRIYTNDFTSMTDGRVRYSPMCNAAGGIVDDMIIYRLGTERYMIVPNASNREKDVAFIRENLRGEVVMEDHSDTIAQLALQGPKSQAILEQLAAAEDIPARYYTFIENAEVAGISCLLSQTGYTGEHGYELYCRTEDAEALWDALMQAGESYGLVPCGLGARDTLRLEAAMPLYGHEMTEDITPMEAGLQFAVKLQKADFIGKAALEAKDTPERARIGLKITGRGIAREHNPIWIGDVQVGETTSGTHCPYLGGAYAMAMIRSAHAAAGTKVQVEVRGRRIDAEVVALPFYKRTDAEKNELGRKDCDS